MTDAAYGAGLRCLVVDDEEVARDVFVQLLASDGFTVVACESLARARQSAGTFDLAIVDKNLPDGSGLDLAAELLGNGTDVEVVLVSAYASVEAALGALRLRVADFVTKPFHVEEVRERLRRVVRGQSLKRQNVRLLEEQKQLQARLIHADRMASVGQLAAGVSHEINNPLAYVIGNHGFVEESLAAVCDTLRHVSALGSGAALEARTAGALLEQLQRCRDVLGEAEEGAQRIRKIVRDLKAFARTDDERAERVDVRAVVKAAVNMMWNEIRQRARLIEAFDDVPSVLASETGLAQVFLNLLLNAVQALPDEASEMHMITVATRSEAGMVCVEVRDTGKGIEPQHMERIFDPFFTTKPVGVGTGLGLSICYGVVDGLGGRITVESEPGKGARFRVYLPAVGALPAHVGRPPDVAGGHGKVLVIEDEPAVARMLLRLLSAEHRVVLVAGGAEALELLATDEGFDIILCDLLMPSLSGMELYAALQTRFPRLVERVVFMTGAAFTPKAREFLRSVPNAHIEKPFDAATLQGIVRRYCTPGAGA